MTGLSPAELASALALVGVVILIAALLSGVVERSGIPQVAVFLGLGAALGPAGVGVLEVGLDSPALHAAATLSLALILFTDALSLDLREAREHRSLALLALGPGTLLSAALFGLAAFYLLGLSGPAAAILGAALASTDPVMLKGLLRRRDLAPAARHALRLESGLNDVVLLPIVLVSLALLSRPASEIAPVEWAKLGLELCLLGPGAGVLVGLFALATLDLVRRRFGVRRDYESLYSLGVAFAAYAGAEFVHGSGFLAAFAAGLTLASFDVELCECFKEYGETTAELALLLTFVLLGSSLMWSGLTELSGAALGFAALVLLGRPAIYLAAFAPARIERSARLAVAWFGPRGLSSLLLVLLAVFAGAGEGSELFRIACLVVLLSIAVHGGSLLLLGRGAGPQAAPAAAATAQRASDPRAAPPEAHESGERISLDALRTLRERGEPLALVDVRSEKSWSQSEIQAQGARRLSPESAADDARILGLPSDAWLALYCT